MTTREAQSKRSDRPLLPGSEAEIEFTDLLPNGQGVGRIGSVVVFCSGPLPGERASVKISIVKAKYCVGELLRLVRSSPERAQPFCPVFQTCGGCQTQHWSYRAQLDWKRQLVRSALERIGGFTDPPVNAAIGMGDPRAYRNKMSLVVKGRSTRAKLGFYEQRSHDVVPIAACPIVMPQLDAAIAQLNAAKDDAATASAFAQARHIVARAAAASGQMVVSITTSSQSEGVARAAQALQTRLDGAVGVTNSFNPSSENAILGRDHRTVAGSAVVDETICGVRYRVSAASFFQVNVEIVGRIFEYLAPRLEGIRAVVDLYCGAGTFALYFAERGARVFGIEENARAIAEANANAKLNGLSERLRFRCGRVEAAVRSSLVRNALRQTDVVFLDPPRKGSDPVTLAAVADGLPAQVWYLSCDPATLARDLKLLAAKGYAVESVQPFDMFPQTGHVEALAILAR